MPSTVSAQAPGAVDPGYTTTEFWQTLLVNLLAAGVAIGSLFSANFNLNGVQSIVPAVAVAAATISQIFYSRSRATVKAAAQAASGQVESAKAASTAAQSGDPAAASGHTNGNGLDGSDRSLTITFGQGLGQALITAK